MKVFAYWNCVDNDCKKIFHFMSKHDKDTVFDEFPPKSLECYKEFMRCNDSEKIHEGIKENLQTFASAAAIRIHEDPAGHEPEIYQGTISGIGGKD